MSILELQDKYIQKIDSFKWYMIRTMPRGEGRAEVFFKSNNISCYLPRFNRIYVNSFTGKNGKKYNYKRPSVLSPMFPGYIFAALDIESLGLARYQRCIAQVSLHCNYSEDELLADLHKVQDFEFLAKSNQLEIKQEIVKGSVVIINSGVFSGWEGVVERRMDNNFVFIRIMSIGFSMGVDCAVVDCDVLARS